MKLPTFILIAAVCAVGQPTYASAGCIEGDCFNGRGTYVWDSGNRYEGDWQAGRRTGSGTFTFANGEKYTGQFRDGTFHGTGTYVFKNGDVYEGQWVNGKQEGRGVHTSADGTRVEGTFRDGILVQDFDMNTEEMHAKDKAPEPPPEQAAPSVRKSAPTKTSGAPKHKKVESEEPRQPEPEKTEQSRPPRRDHDIVKPPSL